MDETLVALFLFGINMQIVAAVVSIMEQDDEEI